MEKSEMEVFREEQLTAEITRISDQLNNIASEDVVVMQERIFENIFIPLFAGDAELIYKVSLETWSTFAGGPYRAVDIVDVSGKILFRVPPLFDRSAINPVGESNVSIAHVVATAGQYSRVHPTQGSAYLNAELNKVLVDPHLTGNSSWTLIQVRSCH